ncbi:MAG TPA: hypothetical protein VNK24_04290 [Elusimicrobiota bacterium]|nr:hypothetical protein [Elusimicrobiota bacterium]
MKRETRWATRVNEIYHQQNKKIDANFKDSRTRGALRVATNITKQRKKAVIAGKKMEVGLERLLTVGLISDPKCKAGSMKISNQFNLLSGIGGNSRKSKVENVDILIARNNRVEFIELKSWEGKDDPVAAAEEIVGYFISFILARKAGAYGNLLEPANWQKFQLTVLAPKKYYENHQEHFPTKCLKTHETKLNEALKNKKSLLLEVKQVEFCFRSFDMDQEIFREHFKDLYTIQNYARKQFNSWTAL